MASGSPLPPESMKPVQRRTEIAGPADSSSRILFLDDDPDRARAFLGRNPRALWVQTAAECIARLAESWDQVHLDHDLGGEIFVDSSRDDCGMEVVRWLCSRPRAPLPNTCFLVHSHNAEAAELMVRNLLEHGYQAVYRPFGVDVLDWVCEPMLDEPDQPPPPPSTPLAPELRGWLGRQLRRFRRSELSRPKADPGNPQGNEPACGSGNFGAE